MADETSAGAPRDPTGLPPVRASVIVRRSVDEAFRLFTEQIDTWWPLATHSVGRGRAVACRVEGRVGGRLYETLDDGSEAEWGEVLTWEPPRRLVFTWHPGRDRGTAQEVEVRFSPVDGGTRVDLEHRGWEAYGEGAAKARSEYESGWAHVLGERFVRAGGACR